MRNLFRNECCDGKTAWNASSGHFWSFFWPPASSTDLTNESLHQTQAAATKDEVMAVFQSASNTTSFSLIGLKRDWAKAWNEFEQKTPLRHFFSKFWLAHSLLSSNAFSFANHKKLIARLGLKPIELAQFLLLDITQNDCSGLPSEPQIGEYNWPQ